MSRRMGTDIHITAQVRREGKWERIKAPEFLNQRNYYLFAFLTGDKVRSRFGGRALLPEPRGFPSDFVGKDRWESADPDPDYRWSGAIEDGHSASWLSLKDMLSVDLTSSEYKLQAEYFNTGWCDCLAYFAAQIPPGGSAQDVRIVFNFDT